MSIVSKIIHGDAPNEIWMKESIHSVDHAKESHNNYSSDLQELLQSVRDSISDLFRLSIAIRKAPVTDEYDKASRRYPNYSSNMDIVYIRDKYPEATAQAWLIERLGKAITRRRQFLLYRKEHQKRLQEIHTLKHDADGKTMFSGTKASTHHPNSERQVVKLIDDTYADEADINTRPVTEYANSSIGKDGATKKLRTPSLPPNVQWGETFECPYCHRLKVVADKKQWK